MNEQLTKQKIIRNERDYCGDCGEVLYCEECGTHFEKSNFGECSDCGKTLRCEKCGEVGGGF